MMLVAWMLATAAVPGSAGPLTPQAQFDQATAALVAGKWSDAAAGFHALGERSGVTQRTRAIAAMREGGALAHLDRGEAESVLHRGLELASPNDPDLRDDRANTLLALAGIERANFDFTAARRDLEAARAATDDPVTQLGSLLSLTGVTMFDEDDAALRYSDEAVRFIAAHKVALDLEGQVHDLRGQVLLNRGDVAGAIVELNITLKDFGGLTTHTDLDDVNVRANLGLAYLLAKNQDKARKLMAMTGEGRVPDNLMLGAPADSNVPSCGGGITPEDVVVVDFGIGDDGAVLYARPIYASHPGPMAVEFARAVYSWSWQPEWVKKVPLFYRVGARIELRCTTASNRPSPIRLLQVDLDAWLDAQHVPPAADDESEARRIPKLRAQLTEREKKGEDVSLIPVLVALAHSSGTTFQEAHEMYVRADGIAEAAHAPAPVRTFLAIKKSLPVSSKRRDEDAFLASLAAMLQEPSIAGDARSAATVRLQLAQERSYREPLSSSKDLDAIIEDKRLDPHDPLRVGALLQMAALKAQQKDLAGARHYYDQTGLNDQQCALVDAQPVKVRGTASERDYPEEAREWGLSGWARTEFDVRADGSTRNVRTVMAYPPFVFGPSIEQVVARQKYTQTFRPEGGLGCGGESFQQGFHYVTPGGY